jgi:peptidoglycan/LPS O-acetylase OafA/YrhL
VGILSEVSMNTRRSRGHIRADIQGLRAMAVLLVVAFHTGLPLPAGFAGVDVFFVISGFVITSWILRQLDAGRFSVVEFYVRRIKRLLPALTFMLVVVLVLSFLLESPIGPQETTTKTGIGAVLLVANLVILRTSGAYFDADATTNPLLHVWSLSVEEQLYLGFPVLVLLVWMIGRRIGAGLRVAVIVIAMLTAVSFTLAVACIFIQGPLLFVSDPTSLAFYFSPTRAWEFGVGILVSCWAHSRTSGSRLGKRPAATIALVGILLLVGTNVLIDQETPWPGIAALLPVGGTAGLIVAGTLASNPVSRLLSARPAMWIGDLSYSLYLWHWPLIVFASILWSGVAARAFAAFVSIVPAWLSYRYVETPLRSTPSRSRIPVLGFGAGSVALIGGLVFALGAFGIAILPTVATYRADRGTLTLGRTTGCMLNGRPYVPADIDRCYSRVSQPKGWVMLVGDSHADAISNGVVTAANHLGYDALALTGAGCGFSRSPAPSKLVPNCAEMNNDLMDRAIGGNPPALVVMSHWGAPRMETEQDWPQSLSSAIAELRQAGVPVLMVLDVPNFAGRESGQTSACRGGFFNLTCTLPREVVETIQGSARAAEIAFALERPSVTIYDPWPLFCDATTCSSVVDGRFAYWDFDHLNAIGGGVLTHDVKKAMGAAIHAARIELSQCRESLGRNRGLGVGTASCLATATTANVARSKGRADGG